MIFFRISLDKLELDFFDFVKIKISGFIQSDGQFEIMGSVESSFNFLLVKMSFNLALDIWNCTEGNCVAGVDHHNPVTGEWASIGTSLHIYGSIKVDLFVASAEDDFDAYIELTDSYAKISLSNRFKVTVLFVSFHVNWSWTHVWSWGPPPIIARQIGDTVYLNMGDDGALRDKPGDDTYANISDESVSIFKTDENGSGNNITVEALGTQLSFTGINHIVCTNFALGNDYLNVNAGVSADLFVHGGNGNDNLMYSGDGTATMYGDAGDDTLLGGAGAGILDGGDGNDTITGGTSDDVITGGAGDDTLNGGDGDNTINGGDGIDTITAGTGDDSAPAGNNTIDGGNGNDIITCGVGDDNITGGTGDDTIDAGEGNNTIDGGEGMDTITSGAGNDDITGGTEDDTINAGDGNNTIHGGDGDDAVTGGVGIDFIYGEAGDDTIIAGDGNNTIDSGDGNNTITSGAGDDIITGGIGNDTIIAGNGKNTINAGNGINIITSGLGDDSITSGNGDDTINAGDGNNTIHGGDGVDTITSGTGADTIYGETGNDIIIAGDGNNTIYGGTGDDIITCGTGNDSYVFELNFGDDTITDSGGSNDRFDFTVITSDLTVTAGTPDFTGTTLSVTCTDGSVTRSGLDIEIILSGSGNDLFYFYTYGSNPLMVDGAAGNDTYRFYGGGGTITVNDRGPISNTDLVYVIGNTPAGDTLTIYADGFQLNTQRIYASGLTTGSYQGVDSTIDIQLGDGDDNVYVAGTSPTVPWKVTSGSGNDTFHVGSDASLTQCVIQNILSVLTLIAGLGLDKLFVNDSSFTATSLGALTASAISGFGVSLSILYQEFEQLTITLGSGNNTFDIYDTDPDATNTIHGGSDVDTITIHATSSQLSLDSGAGEDMVTVVSTGATGSVSTGNDNDTLIIHNTGGAMTFDAGGGDDIVVMTMTGGVTTLSGSDGADQITINGTGDTTTVNGNGGSDIITINMTGGDTTINGDEDLDTINLNGSGGNTWINGGSEMDYFNLHGSGGTTVVNGDNPEDNVTGHAACDPDAANTHCPGDDRFFIQGAGGNLTINGGWGADKYYVSSNADRSLYVIDDVYDDDGPSDSPLFTLSKLSGNLSGITGVLNIWAWDGGNNSSADGLYVGAAGTTANTTAEMTGSMLTGLGMGSGGAIAYHQLNKLYVQAGSGNDTLILKSLASGFTAYFYAGAGNDTLNAGNDSHKLEDIDGIIHFYGEGGTDTVNADDSGNSNDMIGQITEEALSGLGMGTNALNENHIYFADSVINGSTLAVTTTSTNETVNIHLGSGNDTFYVDSIYPTGTTHLYTGAGNDSVVVGATLFGLHPSDLRTADFVNGVLIIDGQDGNDTVQIDDSGDSAPNTGSYSGGTLSGLDMTGSINYMAVENLEIDLGAQNDTFYVKGVPLNQNTTLNMGGGFDTVFLGDGSSSDTSHNLDGFLGTLILSSGDPSAGDNLYIHDQGTTAGKTYTIDRAYYRTVALQGGGTLDEYKTTITRGGHAVVIFDTTETVVLRTTSGNDVINLYAPQREEDPGGGHGSTFTIMAGDGNDILNLGKFIDGSGTTLGLIDILVMVDMGNGNDAVNFTQNLNVQEGANGVLTLDATTGYSLAFIRRTFAQAFPSDTTAWLNLFRNINIFNQSASALAASVFTSILLGLNTTLGGNVMDLGVNVRNTEAWGATLSDNADVIHLYAGVYNVAIEVNSEGGNDTFNVENGVSNTQPLTLNSGSGDDLFYVDYSSASVLDVSLIENTFLAARGNPAATNVNMFDNGIYYVEVRQNGSNWEFRILDANGNPVSIANVDPFATGLTSAWQRIDVIGADTGDSGARPFDTKRGAVVKFGGNFAKYNAGSKDSGAASFNFLYGAPTTATGLVTLTINGGTQNASGTGDMLRFSGDKIATATYSPSSATARAGVININNNLFNFSGIEPLVIQGMATFKVITPDAPATLAIETIDVADMNLADLVLHVVTVDGVVTWRQQFKLAGLAAPETTAFGQSIAMNDTTLVVGAARSGAASGVVYIFIRSGDTWTEQAKLYATDGDLAGGGFGSAVALLNGFVVVGAPNDNRMGANTGAAYVFYLNGSDWSPLGKLVVPDGKAGDLFGSSVAIGSTPNGTKVLIGAPGANAAYIFGRDSSGKVGLQSKINGTSGAFGTAVAISGNQAMVGAPNYGSQGKGYVFIFTLSLVNGSLAWSPTKHLETTGDPQNSNSDLFGSVLALDGNRLVVGAPGFNGIYDGATYNEIGSAWVFNTTSWALEARLTTYDGLPESEAQSNVYAGYHFGSSVSISGNTVIVGAPDFKGISQGQGAVYLFVYLPPANGVDGTWTRSGKIESTSPAQNDHFGKAVAVFGSRVVAGMPGYDVSTERSDVGKINFYYTNGTIDLNDGLDSTKGIYRAEIVQVTDGTAGAGYQTLYHTSSGALLVAAPLEGKVYIYKNEGLFWRLAQTLVYSGSNFGYDMDLYNNTLVVGKPDTNQVIVFNYSGITWVTGNTINGPAGSSGFGKAVAIDNGRIAVGAPDTGIWYESQNQPITGYQLQLGHTGAVFTYTGGNTSWTYEKFIMPYDSSMPEATSFQLPIPQVVSVVAKACAPGGSGDGCALAGDYKYMWYVSSVDVYPRTHVDCSLTSGSFTNYSWDTHATYHGCAGNMNVSEASDAEGTTSHTIYTYANEPNSFGGLNSGQFGAVLDLHGTSLLIGGNGAAGNKLYTVNVTAATHTSWDTTFGKPLRATSYMANNLVTEIAINSTNGQALVGVKIGSYGMVRVFNGSGTAWSQVGSLNYYTVHTTDDAFGGISAIATNGQYTLVGAPGADTYGLNTGLALFYSNGTVYSIGNWVLQSGDASVLDFGQGPAIISEGHYLIGTLSANKLFNFRQRGPTFTATTQESFVPAALPTAKFGSSVAIEGNVAVVGAKDYDGRGAVFIFRRAGPNSDVWTQEAKIQSLDLQKLDDFGAAVAINLNTIVVGAPNNQSKGAVYIFTHSGSTWTQSLRLADGSNNSQFGAAVDINAGTLVVGAPVSNRTFVYHQNGNAWSLGQVFSGSGNFGTAVSVNGDTLLVGAPGINEVLVYHLLGSSWSQLTTWSGTGGSGFGTAVDVSGDWAVVGAPNVASNTGKAYVYGRTGSVWSGTELVFALGAQGDYYGQSVSIDGRRIVVGAYKRAINIGTNNYTNEGAALAFSLKTDGSWKMDTQITPLYASDGASGDYLGYAVAISGTLAISGAPQLNGRSSYISGATDTNGAGYIYITDVSPSTTVVYPEVQETVLDGAQANYVKGTVGGIQFSNVYYFDNMNVVIDTSNGSHQDTITVTNGVKSYGMGTLHLLTGEDNDSVNILVADLSLQTEGKFVATAGVYDHNPGDVLTPEESASHYTNIQTNFTYDGGDPAQSDTFTIGGDANFTLYSDHLESSVGGSIFLPNVEHLFINGGPSANIFNIQSWNGDVTLDGLGGSDYYLINLLLAKDVRIVDSGTGADDEDRVLFELSAGNDEVSPTNTSISLGGNTATYSGIEILTISGMGGDDIFNIDNIIAAVVGIDGNEGSDTININVSTSTSVVYVIDNGLSGADTLNIYGSDNQDSIILTPTVVTVNTNGTVHYNNEFEFLNINGRGDADTFTINGTPGSTTTLYGGNGNDIFTVNTVNSSGITLDGQEGSDTYAVPTGSVIEGTVFANDTGTGNDPDYIMSYGTEGDDAVTLSETSFTLAGIVIYTFGSLDSNSLRSSGVEGVKMNLLGGNDAVTVTGMPNNIAVALCGGDGDDTFVLPNLGSLYDSEELYGLTLDGGAGTNTLVLSASGSSVSGTYATTSISDRIEGLGLLGNVPLYFVDVVLTLNLTHGNDTLTIIGTHDNSQITVNGLNGQDTITVQSTGLNSSLALDGQEGSDTYASPTSSALQGPVTITDTGTGINDIDTITVFGTEGNDTAELTETDFTVNGSKIFTVGSFDTGNLSFSGMEGFTLNLLGGDDTATITAIPDSIVVAVFGEDWKRYLHSPEPRQPVWRQ